VQLEALGILKKFSGFIGTRTRDITGLQHSVSTNYATDVCIHTYFLDFFVYELAETDLTDRDMKGPFTPYVSPGNGP
jgi:hypothetical protein